MPRHKADHLYEREEVEAFEAHEAVQSAKITMLTNEVTHLRDLLAWVGAHIHVRNANGQRTTAKCALCPFTYKKDTRGRMLKETCRHDEIWKIG